MSDIEDAYREASVGMCAVCGLSVCVCVCGICAVHVRMTVCSFGLCSWSICLCVRCRGNVTGFLFVF
jgi:hypothetical protein